MRMISLLVDLINKLSEFSVGIPPFLTESTPLFFIVCFIHSNVNFNVTRQLISELFTFTHSFPFLYISSIRSASSALDIL